jgi:hypothetical protein
MDSKIKGNIAKKYLETYPKIPENRGGYRRIFLR